MPSKFTTPLNVIVYWFYTMAALNYHYVLSLYSLLSSLRLFSHSSSSPCIPMLQFFNVSQKGQKIYLDLCPILS